MTKSKKQIYENMELILTSMLKGKRIRSLLPLNEVPDDIRPFAEVFNKFIHDIVECQDFVGCLVNGDLEAETPSRDNYAAGPLKELHSQLISMAVNINDLCDGKMVSKLYYPGTLFEHYNALITMVSRLLNDKDNNDENEKNEDGTSGVSSWTYHQVLSAINQLTTMVVQFDSIGTLVFANMAAKKRFLDIEQLPNDPTPKENDLLSYLGKFTSIVCRLKPHETYNSRFPVYKEILDKKTDVWYSVETDVARLTDGTFGVIHMINDISEWKYNEQALKNEASRDPLTSTYTRKFGEKKFHEIIDQRKTSNSCVAFIDLDGLKHINDNYGHTEGDYAIKTIASVLMSSVRETDWVIRYGGDEFLILFSDCTEEAAYKIIARMHEQLDGINNAANKPYNIQFSEGLTHIDEDMDDMQKIVDEIDEKMYRNKVERKKKLQCQGN